MCLVIDTCCLAMVFDEKNNRHYHFQPVLDWVTSGDGKMIYGGTKYKSELKEAYRYLGIVSELKRSRRAIELSDSDVDTLARRLKILVVDPEFNDEHIAALVIASRCCVVCTNDNTAISYLKRPALFSPYKMRRPRIYSSNHNRGLCCKHHIVAVCKGDEAEIPGPGLKLRSRRSRSRRKRSG